MLNKLYEFDASEGVKFKVEKPLTLTLSRSTGRGDKIRFALSKNPRESEKVTSTLFCLSARHPPFAFPQPIESFPRPLQPLLDRILTLNLIASTAVFYI